MVVCVFNILPHYRKEIYDEIEKKINCDIYAGDKLILPIKKIDSSKLKNFKTLFKNIYFKQIYWQKGFQKVFKRKYSHYIITGEVYCITNWIILIYCKFFNKKAYLWGHGLNGHEKYLRLFFKKRFYKLAYKTFLYGDYAKEHMQKLGFKKESLVPIYNSLGYHTQLEVRRTLKGNTIYKTIFNNNFPVLFFVGRIQNDKKLHLIIEAMNILFEEGHKVNLMLIGRIIHDHKLKESIKKNNLSNHVYFKGPLFNESELGNLIYNADVCVSPGFVGLTAMHSLSYGTPVITHNNYEYQAPEFEVIKNNLTGSFFKYDDVNDLKNKIIDWITISLKQREYIRKNCYKIIDEKYNPYYQINIIEKTINMQNN